MKKVTNNFAYIPGKSHDQENSKNTSQKININPNTQLSYAILEQMGQKQTDYLKKLIMKAKQQNNNSNNQMITHQQSFQSIKMVVSNQDEEIQEDQKQIQKIKQEEQKIFVNTNKRQQNNHERTKSYGGQYKTRKQPMKDYIFSHRGQKNKAIIPDKFYSGSNTPVSYKNQQRPSDNSLTQSKNNSRQKQQKQGSLIESIDGYLSMLGKQLKTSNEYNNQSFITPRHTNPKSISNKKLSSNNNSKQKQRIPKINLKTVINSNILGQNLNNKNISMYEQDNTKHNLLAQQNNIFNNNSIGLQAQLIKKLQNLNNYSKSLKLSNHILETEKKKLVKKQQKMKKKMYSMLEHIRDLTTNLQKQRHQRKKAQKSLKDIHSIQMKFMQGKKSNKNTKNKYNDQISDDLFSEYLDSQITSYQDDDTIQNMCSQESQEIIGPGIIQSINKNINSSLNSTKKMTQKSKTNFNKNNNKFVGMNVQ